LIQLQKRWLLIRCSRLKKLRRLWHWPPNTQTTLHYNSSLMTKHQDAQNAFNQFYAAQRNSKCGWEDFSKIIIATGPLVRDYTDFSSQVESLAAFSKAAGVTSSMAADLFSNIALGGASVDETGKRMAALWGGTDNLRKVLREGGTIAAVEEVSQKLANGGEGAALMASGLGLDALAVQVLKSDGPATFKAIDDAMKEIIATAKSINDKNKETDTTTRELELAWIEVTQAFEIFIEKTGLLKFVSQTLSGISTIVESLGFGFSRIGGWIDDAAKATGAWLGTIKPIRDAVDGLMTTLAGPESLIPPESPLVKAHKDLQSLLTGKVGLSPTETATFISKAATSGQMENLVNALQSGLQPGRSITIQNTFAITSPAGGATITAQQVASEIYRQFHSQVGGVK
jgi:hypothetical protein